MTRLYPARDTHIADRRRKVAYHRLRGLSYREIMRALPEGTRDGLEPVVNPDTGEAYEVSTIKRDIKWLEAEWRKEALDDLSEQKARHVAQVEEVVRAAWKQNKIFYVLKALEHKAEVLGLNQLPEGPHVNVNIANFDMGRVPTDELRRMAQVIDAAAGVEAPPRDDPGVVEAG